MMRGLTVTEMLLTLPMIPVRDFGLRGADLGLLVLLLAALLALSTGGDLVSLGGARCTSCRSPALKKPLAALPFFLQHATTRYG